MMKSKNYVLKVLTVILLAIIFVSPSCKKDDDKTGLLKVGLVSGVGGFDDRGFNQLALDGLKRAGKDFSIHTQSRESFDTAQLNENVRYFSENGFDVIIALGYETTKTMLAEAIKHPEISFALVDDIPDNPPSNLHSFVFRVDQSSFLCGILAAYWADFTDPQYPLAGWIAGPEIDEIEHFLAGYSAGINYYNTIYNKNIPTIGSYCSSFNDTLEGATLANTIINVGADVIFPFAGKTGNGALYKAKELGKCAIGVDLDQYISIPEVSGILLSSCLKKLDNTVYELINKRYWGGWGNQQIHWGDLKGGSVDIAPFHNYDAQIPDHIKNLLNTVRTGIEDGTISTGWNP